MPFAEFYVVFRRMKKRSLLAGLVILASACGGGDKKTDRKALTPPPPDPTANGEDLNGEMSDGDDAEPVKFLIKREDGLLYAVKSVSDLPYSGKIEEMSQTDGSLSVKNYQEGVLISFDEYFSGSEQKKSSTTFDALGEVVKKEEWREDGTKVVAASQLPKANSKYIGRNVKWDENNLTNIYRDKPTSTVIKVFGAPNDRKIRTTATTRTETWVYNNIKVLNFNDSVTLRTLIFEISRNKVMSVQLENAP